MASYQTFFDKVGCRVRYGENALVPPLIAIEMEDV
jgi:hypothetical protein